MSALRRSLACTPLSAVLLFSGGPHQTLNPPGGACQPCKLLQDVLAADLHGGCV